MNDTLDELLGRLRAKQSDGRGRTKTRNDAADMIEAQARLIDQADKEYEKLRVHSNLQAQFIRELLEKNATIEKRAS